MNIRAHLLDRNAVAEISLWEQQKKSTPKLIKLKDLDKKGVIVSPLLSIIEGNQRENRTAVTLLDCLEVESRLISNFFRQAQLDTLFLTENPGNLVLTLVNEVKKNQDVDVEFVQCLQDSFHNQKGKSEVKAQYKLAIDLINSNSRQLADPLSLVGIATALGSEHARRVLKPKSNPTHGDAFNAFADIEKIAMKNYMQHIANETRSDLKFSIFTFDKGLKGYAQTIRIKESRSARTESHEFVQYSIDVDTFLNNMPFLREMKKFREEVKAELSSMNFLV